MNQYLDLVKTVLNNGSRRTNRTGVDTIMYFGYHYKVNLQDGFPLLTTKKVYFNSFLLELYFINKKHYLKFNIAILCAFLRTEVHS